MKKVLLFTAAAIAAIGNVQAQSANRHAVSNGKAYTLPPSVTASKTTAVGDTFVYSNVAADNSDTPSFFTYNVAPNYGPITGPNSFGDKGWAERYNFSSSDSSIRVIGAVTWFAGRVAAGSTKNIVLKAYAQGPKVSANGFTSPNINVDGYPGATLASQTIPYTVLGGTGPIDSISTHFFATPSAFINDTFFIGYEVSYSATALAGDTIGLVTTDMNDREGPFFTAISTTDTVIHVANAVLWSDDTWRDEFQENSNSAFNYFIWPIVEVGNPVSIKGISQKGLTFFGCFPNPANSNTNVRIALNKAADVTVRVMDMAGRVVATVPQQKFTAGEQIIPVSTASLASGTYIVSVQTSNGEGIAQQITVAK